jgi:hypothetical protein
MPAMFTLTRKLARVVARMPILALLVLLVPAARASSAPPAAASPGTKVAAPVLPWIEDDYTRAVAQAKARKIPIFVESWAPW